MSLNVLPLPNTATGGAVGGASNLTTVGAVPYVSASGVLNQDASNFFWDATNHRLGIGTNAPGVSLDVTGTIGSPLLQFNSSGFPQIGRATGAGSIFNGSVAGDLGLRSSGAIALTNGGPAYLYMRSTGAVGIGPSNTSPTGTLSVLDRTATTGATSLLVGSDGTNVSATTTQFVVVAGATDAAGNEIVQFQNSAGQKIFGFNLASSQKTYDATSGKAKAQMTSYSGSEGVAISSDAALRFWSGDTLNTGSADAGLSRIAPGVTGVGTGTAGSTAGAAAMNTLGVGVTPTNTANVSQIVVKAGSSQSSTDLQQWQNSAGTVLASVGSSGAFSLPNSINVINDIAETNSGYGFTGGSPTIYKAGSQGLYIDGNGLTTVINGGNVRLGGSADTSLSRIGTGIVGAGTGAASSVAGSFQATKYISAGTAFITWGTGTPEAAVTATVGSIFLRTDGGAATTLYVKESGSGNTGWVAK